MVGALSMAALLAALSRQLRRFGLVLIVLAVGIGSGYFSVNRERAVLTATVPVGRVELAGRLLDDPSPTIRGLTARFAPHTIRKGEWVAWKGPPLMARFNHDPGQAGDELVVLGELRPHSITTRDGPAAGRLAVRTSTRISGPRDPLLRLANAIRHRVAGQLARVEDASASALLSGFMVGDVRALSSFDQAAMRKAGLSHLVAVSGSNVALFLLGLYLVTGPLGWTPRRRALLGLGGVAMFVLVTRWEPSVLRAAVMASMVLVGKVTGVAWGGWSALGAAVTLLLAVSPQLAIDLGFQLSVAATAGVLLAGRVVARRGWLAAIGIGLGAQAAVAPILLARVGVVPLFSPLTNLVAIPLASAATSLGAIGAVTGFKPLLALAAACARAVLGLARLGMGWPQVGWLGTAAVGVGLALTRLRRLRVALGLGVALLLTATVIGPSPPSVPTVWFLDVGQGDAALIQGSHGEAVLIDAGTDPGLLGAELARRNVRRLELAVISHGHLDHFGGMRGLFDAIEVDALWYPDHPEADPGYRELLAEAEQVGVRVETPKAGWVAEVGELRFEVIGPTRRYENLNDQGLVLLLTAAEATVLFPGDIEALGQQALGDVRPDVLKVPHHGSRTSDPAWLAQLAPRLAVVSVGENDYGHPNPEIMAVLEQRAGEVMRTDEEGTIRVPLG